MLRFLGDEDAPGPVLQGLLLKEPGLDLVRAVDVGLDSTPDPLVLEWAAGQGRIVLTRDRSTMTEAAYDRVRRGLPMPGMIVMDSTAPRGELIEWVLTVADCYLEEEMKDQVVFVPIRS